MGPRGTVGGGGTELNFMTRATETFNRCCRVKLRHWQQWQKKNGDQHNWNITFVQYAKHKQARIISISGGPSLFPGIQFPMLSFELFYYFLHSQAETGNLKYEGEL